MSISANIKNIIQKFIVIFLLLIGVMVFSNAGLSSAETSTGSVGLEGKISSAPPTTGATITFPVNGSTTNETSTNVVGICPKGLMVKIFKNNIFAGSVKCETGSYAIKIDIFIGNNQLIARVYDDLDQAGPDSNMVNIIVSNPSYTPNSQVLLTSNYAKRGSSPGNKLTWPIILSGGTGPYAISVDWGDGRSADLISRQFAGNFDIEHIYENPGVYTVIIRATDKNGYTAFLQVVAVSNGAVSQTSQSSDSSNSGGKTSIKILWLPVVLLIPLMITTFYLGRRYELKVIRRKLEQRDKV